MAVEPRASSASAPRSLEYGKHGLAVFSEPRFSRLKLSDAPLEKRTHVLVFHQGRSIPVRKVTRVSTSVRSAPQVETLVHVLKDPARKGGVLALRKARPELPWGEYNLYAVDRSGAEERVGTVSMERLNDSEALLHSGNVTAFANRSLFARHPLEAKARARFKKIHAELSALTAEHNAWIDENYPQDRARKFKGIMDSFHSAWPKYERAVALQERLRAAWLERDALEKAWLKGDDKPFKETKRSRPRSYRRNGLFTLLLGVVEEVAKRQGVTRLDATLSPSTTGQFLPRHGWEKTGDRTDYGAHSKFL